MNKITFTDSYQNRTRKTKRWLGMLAFCVMLFGGQTIFAQDCEISVTISSSTWGDVTTWELLDGNNEAVLSGGPYEDGFSDTQTYTATTPPYTLSITIDDWFWCDNVIDYEVTVGGNIDISGTVEAVCGDIYTWDFPLETDLTDCIPDCPAPSGLTATNTHNTAELSWTGSGTLFDIEFLEASETATGTPTDTDITSPYDATGLDPATEYKFYVRAICDSGESSWAGPFSFTTELTPPACGEMFYDNGGANENYLPNSNNTYVIYPENPGDVVSITFISFNTENSYDGLMIYDGTDTSAPLLSSGGTGFWGLPDGAWCGTGDFSPEGMTFTSTDSSGALTFVFTSDSGVQYAGWEAMVTCGPAPTCPTPVDVVLDGEEEAYEASFSWSAADGAESYNWYVFADGANPMEDTHLFTGNTTDTTVTVDGLTPETSYDFYVKTDCGTDGESMWSTKVDFRTAVACEVPEDLLVTDITLSSAVLNWEGTSNLYDIEWGEAGFEQGGTDSELETGIEENSFSLDNLEAETEYQFYVRQDCGDDGVSQWAGPFSFNTGYCLVSTVYDGDYISAFSTTEAIENATYSTSSQPAGSYADETAQIIEQVAGGSFDFSTTYEGGNNGTNIWIDWNNDLVFDDSEKEYSEFSGVNKTGTITIPEGTEAGDYRMRVRALWGSGSADPDACGENNWGSTIDFTVRVVEDETDPCDGITTPEIESPQSLDEGQTLADVVVTAGENLTWYTDEGLTETADTSEALTEGEYTFFVTQTVGDCTSEATEVVITVTLSLSEFDTTQLKVYPNPTNSELNISYTDTINQVEVYNLLGQKVITQNFESNNVSLDVSNLSNGSYVLILHANGLKQQVKIVKK